MAQERKKAATTGRPRKPKEKKPDAVKEAAPEIITPPAGTPENIEPTTSTPENTEPPASAPDSTDHTADGWEVARVLKVTKPLMKGDDVKALQAALISHNYHCGVDGASGAFERNTAHAVRCFQSVKGLIVDGKAGRYTVAALGGTWKG